MELGCAHGARLCKAPRAQSQPEHHGGATRCARAPRSEVCAARSTSHCAPLRAQTHAVRGAGARQGLARSRAQQRTERGVLGKGTHAAVTRRAQQAACAALPERQLTLLTSGGAGGRGA